jgi:hypothetical protein
MSEIFQGEERKIVGNASRKRGKKRQFLGDMARKR